MILNIDKIKLGCPGISAAWGAVLFESCVVSLHKKNHNQAGTKFRINGTQDIQSKLKWKVVLSDQLERTYNEQNKATELGAECLAILIILKLTEYTVVKRTPGKNGFDYWLGKKGDHLFQNAARLEISGLFEGTNTMIDYRYNKKKTQTKQSDTTLLPAYVVVIEFSNPKAKWGRREN